MIAGLTIGLVGNAGEAGAQQDLGFNPIPSPIAKSGIKVEVGSGIAMPSTRAPGATNQLANINFLYPALPGSGLLFVVDARGPVWIIKDGVVQQPAMLDLRTARAGAFRFADDTPQMGFRSIAFHPDCGKVGRLGNCKLYTAHTETVDSAPSTTKLFKGGPGFIPIHHNVIDEWNVDLSGALPKVDLASRRELMRVEQNGINHGLDTLMFNPNAAIGDPDYGLMYFGTGDGTTSPMAQDPNNQAQDTLRLLGKLGRIDPLQQGVVPYTVPASNPFFNQPATHLPEVYAFGLRHPQNLAFDTAGQRQLIIIDLGERHVEEVNLAIAGANYAWPLREGTFVNDRSTDQVLYALPPGDAAFGYTYPVAQYDRNEGKAIVGGYVYRGTKIPELYGHYIFGDIVMGRVFHVPAADLVPGHQAQIKELILLFNGQERTYLDVLGASRTRVDLRFGIDQQGEMYVMSKMDGIVRALKGVGGTTTPPPPPPSASSGLIAPVGAITASKPAFQWAGVAGADGYPFQVTGNGKSYKSWIKATALGCTAAGQTCTYNGLTLTNGTYAWNVRARVVAANGSKTTQPVGSATFSIGPTAPPSQPPSSPPSSPPPSTAVFSPSGVSVAKPAFTWPFVANADGYPLAVKNAAGQTVASNWLHAANVGCTEAGQVCSVSKNTFAPGAYSWTVRARVVAANGTTSTINVGGASFTVP